LPIAAKPGPTIAPQPKQPGTWLETQPGAHSRERGWFWASQWEEKNATRAKTTNERWTMLDEEKVFSSVLEQERANLKMRDYSTVVKEKKTIKIHQSKHEIKRGIMFA
jgi:putative SOS response-associated peptidase YedK